MATEAQRLIGISLAKIAQSRCGRGGVSLHKNLLVATVLQKARFIFMEEAYHMVHGHYLQANKFLEPDIDIQDDPTDTLSTNDSIDECELDDIFDSPASSIGKDEDSSEDFSEELCNKENNPPETTTNSSNLVYLDLDKHIQKASQEQAAAEQTTTNESSGSNKRRREISEWETEEAVLSILPKKIKSDAVDSCSETDSIYSADDDIFLSDRISSSNNNNNNNNSNSTNDDDNTAAINLSVNVSRELELDELNNNINNNNNNNLVSNNNNTNTSNNNTLENGPSMEGIDRITSLVSIFSFGNLTRSVSTPDLCSAQATKDSCNSESSISQRTYLAMTV